MSLLGPTLENLPALSPYSGQSAATSVVSANAVGALLGIILCKRHETSPFWGDLSAGVPIVAVEWSHIGNLQLFQRSFFQVPVVTRY